MATVNPESLNVLTRDQAEKARRIIDDIGHVSNGLGPTDAAAKLDKARSELKALFSAINNDRYPVIR
jgi:hypothetical protein